MSLPVDLPAPLAVLVLAWDEATPAVRALVAATQAPTPTVPAILVMVPQAAAPAPIHAAVPPPLAPPATELPVPVATPPAASSVSLPHPLPAPVAGAADAPAAAQFVPALAPPAGPAQPLATAATTLPVAPLVWAAVRVLRLGSLSLPQLAHYAGQPLPAPTWTGPAALPAAPYLGAALATGLAASNGARPAIVAPLLSLPAQTAQPIALPPEQFSAATPLPRAVAAPPAISFHEPAEPLAQAADLEADLAPSDADPALFETAGLSSETSGEELLLPEPDAVAPGPAQAGWTDALASLQQPAAQPALREEASTPALLPEEPVGAVLPALQAAPAHYPAPDLNFQIIQYARFAVPVALAEAPFAAIYAPAWPTWLAAQELRHRTGRPLVLHVAAVAAAEDESVETAAGWIAELQRQALHRADLILTETPALAQRLRRELGLAAGRVQAIAAADTGAIAHALHAAQAHSAK